MFHRTGIRLGIGLEIGLGIAVMGCGPSRASSPAVNPSTAEAISSADEVERTPVPESRWVEHYTRQCHGSITPPVPSVDGTMVVLCDGLFSLGSGRYEGRAPLGVMALLGGTAITDDYSGGGLSLRTLDASSRVLRQIDGGQPERVALASDGRLLAVIDTTEQGRRLTTWTVPELDRQVELMLPRAGSTDALAVSPEGFVRWYGQLECQKEQVPCPGGVTGICGRSTCQTSGLVVQADGHSAPWALPDAMATIAIDPSAEWVAFVDEDGRRFVQPVDEPQARLTLPGTSTGSEWSDVAVALTTGAEQISIADADGVELWRREGTSLEQRAALPHRDVETVWLSDDGQTLLLTHRQDLTVLRPRSAPQRETLPSIEPPIPDGWERAPLHDGVPAWPEDVANGMSPGEPGLVVWARDEYGSDFRVVKVDREEIGRPELSVKQWARVVLERADDLPWEDGQIDMPHTLHHWVEDGERRLQLHYTTQGGCEHYEVVRRVVERGDWLVTYELQMFEGMPWRKAWAVMVEQPLGSPPRSTPVAVVRPRGAARSASP